jgi:hypothetical protein
MELRDVIRQLLLDWNFITVKCAPFLMHYSA